MDQELKAFLEEQFARVNQQFGQMGERFDRMEARADRMEERADRMEERADRMEERADRMEETLRHTQVTVEAVHDDVRLIAEGVMGLTERFELFQGEMALSFKQVQASIQPYYENLNVRMRVLEERAERQTGDVLDAIRKKYGRPQDS